MAQGGIRLAGLHFRHGQVVQHVREEGRVRRLVDETQHPLVAFPGRAITRDFLLNHGEVLQRLGLTAPLAQALVSGIGPLIRPYSRVIGVLVVERDAEIVQRDGLVVELPTARMPGREVDERLACMGQHARHALLGSRVVRCSLLHSQRHFHLRDGRHGLCSVPTIVLTEGGIRLLGELRHA